MKLSILSILLFLSIFASGQDEKSFTTLEYKTVLNRLFDKASLNVRQEAIWKPNYAERINMPVSDDGFCHTSMDTTMYYTSGNTKHAVIIFATYEYQGGVKASCHACVPTLSLASFTKAMDGVWHLDQFKKDFIRFGSWGKSPGKLGIEKLGEDFYCLRMQSVIDGNQGYEKGVSAYYSLNGYEQFNEVFSYVYYDSNEGAMEEGKGYTEETTMRTSPIQEDFYLIELTSKHTGKKLSIKKRFKYSEEDGCYIPCN